MSRIDVEEGKYSRDEIRRLIEEACNDAATQAVALFVQHLKDWVQAWIRKLAMQLLGWLWKPAVVAVLCGIAWIVYKLREYL